MAARKSSSFLMFPRGKPQESPVGFEELTSRLDNVKLGSSSETTSDGQSAKLSYIRDAPNGLGFRTRKPVAVEETPSQSSSNGPTGSSSTLPDVPELSTPQARQIRLDRLAREAKSKAEAQRLYVSVGGTLVGADGKRDFQKTAAIREELKKEEEAKRLERERRERNKVVFEARECFEERWGELVKSTEAADGDQTPDKKELAYEDVPWPVFGGCLCHPGPKDLEDGLRATPQLLQGESSAQGTAIQVDSSPNFNHNSERRPSPYLTTKSIDTFLFHPARPDLKSSRAQVLNLALKRFHPDKFTARILTRIRGQDRERVEIDAKKVVQILTEYKNTLSNDK